jgi:hypothetical protein
MGLTGGRVNGKAEFTAALVPIITRRVLPAYGVNSGGQSWFKGDEGMLTVIIVNAGIVLVYPYAIGPVNFNDVGAFTFEKLLGEPEMHFSRGGWNDRIGGRFRTFKFGMGAGS